MQFNDHHCAGETRFPYVGQTTTSLQIQTQLLWRSFEFLCKPRLPCFSQTTGLTWIQKNNIYKLCKHIFVRVCVGETKPKFIILFAPYCYPVKHGLSMVWIQQAVRNFLTMLTWWHHAFLYQICSKISQNDLLDLSLEAIWVQTHTRKHLSSSFQQAPTIVAWNGTWV